MIKFKVRKWASVVVDKPWDVILLDESTGVMWSSPNTYKSKEHADTAMKCYENIYTIRKSILGYSYGIYFFTESGGFELSGTKEDFDSF